MDKKSIRINFNFNIAKNKYGRNNSHFKTKHYKNKDNLIGVIIGFIVLVIFAICLSSGCAKRITPVPEIRYVPVTDSTAVNELVLTKELLRRTQDSLNAYKSDTTISADYFVAKYKLERIRYYNDIAGKGNNIKYLRGWIRRTLDE